MKTGILCHGRHVGAVNWREHQFGNPEKGLGQILKTCQLANVRKPEIIVFGTGASEKDGLKEADFTIKYMFDHFDELKNFSQFDGVDLNALRRYMKDHSIAETQSQDTYEEIARASEIFGKHGVDEVIVVSNPDHISRCFQLAHNFYQKKKPPFDFYAAQSDIGYDGTTSVTSKIIERPHRGDDSSFDLSSVIGKYFSLSPDRKKEFVEQVTSFLGD